MSEFDLHDSGYRREFGTGAVRDTDDGKSRPDALSPYALERFGAHMAKGFLKYGEFNFEKGIPVSQLVASLERHLNAFKRGDRSEDHCSAMLFNVQAIIHFESLAKLGDATALAMLDRYASKHLADELRYEAERELEEIWKAEEAAKVHEAYESYIEAYNSEPAAFKVGDRVVTNRDITGKMLYGGSSEIRTPAGTLGEIRNDFGDSDDHSLKYNVKFANGDAWNVNSDWFNLAPEPETLVGRTVRVTRDVTKEEYFDGITAGGFHLYSGQILEVVALKDDGLYICQGTKFSPYFFGAVEDTAWEFDHVKAEWVEPA